MRFDIAGMTFSASAGVDKTMNRATGYDTFPSGGHLVTGTDVLVGHADFGAGLDTFFAARKLATLDELDGLRFSTFDVANGASASTGEPTSGRSGPRDIRRVAIAGSTMAVCTEPVGAIATCDPARLRRYVLGEQQPGGPVIDATDGAHDDSFNFQVAPAGTAMRTLRADVLGIPGPEPGRRLRPLGRDAVRRG